MTRNVIVGYGTLMLRESMERTLPESRSRDVIPVVVEGFRRLYNFAPAHYESACRICADPLERAAANVAPAEGVILNGLAVEVSAEERRDLDARERDYQRASVDIVSFDSGMDLGKAEIYLCPADHPRIETDAGILLPHWRDLLFARVGAYRVSEAFGRLFDETAFLADSTTLAMDRYADVAGELRDEAGLGPWL